MCKKNILFWCLFYLLLTSKVVGSDTETKDVIPQKDLRRLTTTIENIKKHYYRAVSNSILLTGAISGMLSGLDPHSEYIDKESLRYYTTVANAEISGIGVELVPEQGILKVITPIDDTPAYRAGIKPDDYIVQINGILTRDMTLQEATSMLRGKKGGIVVLTIVRTGESKPLVFRMRRDTMKIQTVKENMLTPGYGYIRISLFSEPTAQDVEKAIKRLQKKAGGKLRGLLLDIRNNPGGVISSAIDIVNSLLDANVLGKNKLIVYARGQAKENLLTAKASPGDLLLGAPIVMLINGGTVSAGEIVAGALQDHKRAIIVGAKSFGKGSTQAIIPIDNSSAIKLTTGLYFTPFGRSIQAKGIEPDIVIENIQLSPSADNQEIPKIDEASLVGHIPNAKDPDAITNKAETQATIKKELSLAYKDYQLYEALQILRSQNITRNSSL